MVKDSVSFKSKTNKSFTFRREQFPLVLAYAITCHASQGLTKDYVLIDFRGGQPKHGMLFVAFSRARTLDGVYFKAFDISYIKCDPNVNRELHRLETSGKYNFSSVYNYDQYFVNSQSNQPSKEVKCTYLNMNGILHSNHFQCLQNDINIMNSDVLCIAESKLGNDVENNEVTLEGYSLKSRLDHPNGSASMGMLLYTKSSVDIDISTHNDDMWQCLTAEIKEGIIHFVYIHPNINAKQFDEFKNYFRSKIEDSRFLALIGDLNVRYEIGSEQPRRLDDTCEFLSLKNSFSKTTHNSGGQLDYVLVPTKFPYNYLSGVFRNLYSDHSAVFLRFTPDENAIVKTYSCEQSDYCPYPCSVCRENVGANSLLCTQCKMWTHKRCSHLKKNQKITQNFAQTFICKTCTSLNYYNCTSSSNAEPEADSFNSNSTKTKENIDINIRTNKPRVRESHEHTKPHSSSLTSTNSRKKSDDQNVNVRQKPSENYPVKGFINEKNDCWLNSILQVLLHCQDFRLNSPDLQLSQIYLDDKNWSDLLFKCLLDFSKDPGNRRNVENRTIKHPVNGHEMISFKHVFAELTKSPFLKTRSQQDAAEAMDLVVRYSNHLEFFRFQYQYKYKCAVCNHESFGLVSPENKLRLQVTEPTRTFIMNDVFKNYIYSDYIERNCPNIICNSNSSQYTYLMVTPPSFLIVDLQFYEYVVINRAAKLGHKRKLLSHCTPLPHLEIPSPDGISHKFVLEGIIEHLGDSLNSGHYVTYIKKQNQWYHISDQSVNPVTQLSRQPYISLYRLES